MLIKNEEFEKLSHFVKSHFGINLTEKKKTLVTSRLNKVMTQMNFENFDAYYQYVIEDSTGERVAELLNRITTNHTFFNREKLHFEYLKDHILPELNRTHQFDRDLRIWSAGCSTGDEAYTITMQLFEYFGLRRSEWDTKILATDISTEVLDKARKGFFNREQIGKLPLEWQNKYFKLSDSNSYIIADDVRENVIFRRFNLMNTFPFRKKFDVIFCRNVMIYFDRQTKEQLVNRFYQSMAKGGYLFIGHSETLDKSKTPFDYVMPSIYRKVP